MLLPGGRCDHKAIAARFQKGSIDIEPDISKFNFNILSAYQI